MTDIPTLKLQRGRIKGSLTKAQQFANSINSNTTIEEIAARLDKLEEFYNAFTKLDDALVLKEVDSDFDDFEDKYFTVRGQLSQALNQRMQTTPSTASTDQLNSTMIRLFDQQKTILSSFSQHSSSGSSTLEVKLPKINIPSFSGDYKDWPSFKDLFISSVDQKPSLSNVHKFQYLKSALTGDAASLIKHITITDSNYAEAWKKLVSRYDKKKQILTSYIKTFINQTSVTQSSSFTLRKLTDTSDELIRGIKSLGAEASNRDPWLVYILLNKCDTETRQAWAEESHDVDLPTFDQFLTFLNKRCDTLESIDSTSRKSVQKPIRNLHAKTSVQCPKCSQSHHLFHCPEFKGMDTASKRSFVAQNRVCFNCLSIGHQVQNCKSKTRCHYCNKMHHSILHHSETCITNQMKSHYSAPAQISSQQASISQPSANQLNPDSPAFTQTQNRCSISENPSQLSAFTSMNQTPIRLSVLPTALVLVTDAAGSLQPCRILIDSGSQASFISADCAQRLGHKREKAKIRVTGLGSAKSGITQGSISLTLYSRFEGNQKLAITALILPKLTSKLPSTAFNIKDWSFLQNCELADPHFNIPNKIDILLGADHCFYILKDGRKIISPEMPVIQNTMFGYILSGNIITSSTKPTVNCFHTDIKCIEKTLQRFWEVEEVTKQEPIYSEEEQHCENLFATTHTIDETTGRYVVHLPFKKTGPHIGETENVAISRLLSLERRFKSNPKLYENYRNFMSEYQALGHMELLPSSVLASTSGHAYLPHHAVLKPSSTTTKLRVVFDGSAASSSGVTLNQILCVGPKIQRDLYHILLSFRTYRVAITADIEKMYRQVLVAHSDRDYQRIVWRDSPAKPVQHFLLNTVTYGTAPAPFLATRALKQLGIDSKGKYPLAEHAIENSFYVDDLLSGTDDVLTALKLHEELTTLLQSRGFTLHKWASNSESFLRSIPENILKSSVSQRIDEHADTIKVLGLAWIPSEDSFIFHVDLPSDIGATKRNILSNSSRIFDPVGFLSPVTITIKILLQQLWLKNYEWDEPIYDEIAEKWKNFASSLCHLKKLRIPRWLQTSRNTYELHGFADASEAAYAAAVYCRSCSPNGEITTTLVTSKTKVSPIKQVSIPRLELCGALLLAKLMSTVKTALQEPDISCVAWTDSKVVLAWLSAHPSKWKCYIGNRTSEILSTLPREAWHHVHSKDNPADLPSRGIPVRELLCSTLWWKGPSWLQSNWRDYLHDESSTDQQPAVQEELRPRYLQSYATTIENETLDYLFSRMSNFTKILRVIARCFRFASLCRKSDTVFKTIWLTTMELEKARIICIQWTQSCTFDKDANSLKKKGSVSHTSPLRALTPFLDSNNIIRVGGRLKNSYCTYDTKHPIILPKDHIFTRLLIAHLHQKHFHAGTTLLLNIIRQTYWIVSARTAVKSTINKCIICVRHRASVSQQLMADLPHHRVSFTRAFENVGVDYAGPIMLLLHRGRGARSTKGYICLFTCFSTRALHLEAVSDLTSDAFLACLKRFISRRGLPVTIYSDNGTNFVGANRQITDMYKKLLSITHNSLIADFLSDNKVTWHFTPPSAPHFGGSWESGVKLVKSHLRRTIGETKLTYEELSTFLAQVEALLNSRPLTQMSSDESNLDVLTPAHFLIGQPMTALPEPSMDSAPLSSITRWRLLQKMHQDFWRRWHVEYLTTLQQRPKWTNLEENLAIGNLVLIKEDNLPPTAWLLGRITAVHPGRDNLIRVVTLKTARGEIKRPITKLCTLPIC